MGIHLKGIIIFPLTLSLLFPLREFKIGFMKLQVISSFLLFLFTVVATESGGSALNEISYTRCTRGGLGPLRWTSRPD